jgi:hypothetical protein
VYIQLHVLTREQNENWTFVRRPAAMCVTVARLMLLPAYRLQVSERTYST